MRPGDFWSATLDEAVLTYRGKVDEWRFFRNGFNLLHRSFADKPANILEEIPLPFDDEITVDKGNTESLIDEYNRLKASGALD